MAGASVFLMFTSIAIRGVGFLREIIFAKEFGLSKEFDIYLIASIIPITTNTVIYFIGQNYFIPYYSQISAEDKSKAFQFLRSSLLSFGIIGFFLGAIFFLFAQSIISIFINSSSPIEDSAVFIFRLFALTIPIASYISIIAAYLNKEKRFLPPAFSSLSLNLIVIISVTVLNSKIGIISIAIGYLVGSVAQLIYLFYSSEIKNIIFSKIKEYNWSLRDVASSSLFMIIIIESIGQFYSIADRFFISSVREGGISAINYAQILVSLPISIIAIPLSTALFPKISNDLYANSSTGIEITLKDSIKVTLLIFIPVFYIFNFFGVDIISLLLQRGKFNDGDTHTTAEVLRYLNLGLLFYAIYAIFNKVLYSAKLITQLLYITLIGVMIKIFFNFYLVKLMNFNGLALSTSISYIFFFIASVSVIVKNFQFNWVLISSLEFIVLFSNALVAFTITEVLISSFNFTQLITFILKMFFFVGIYLINLILIRHSGIKIIYDRLIIRKVY